ncbi:TetR/AcrR family transcriptional regulator [Tardiphaga sp. P9-11]|uniref:TetR/AcrR family transcriptional regulator n=1 Tax=Tardiphaga sp. P9-11 TaxID=2024614 RepID=UPI0011F10CD6|nr:TetR/AcrR family transcriptional regulator [Tardiphaga sp. P9-11]KAA0070021.1 TetR/AcrR family transcriptional regulator [Tardiphaga sp. P9-11]
MKVSKEKAAQHHEAIISAGSRMIRERGFDGVGVAEIMSEAGLTQGAFYGHFASKDALCVEACRTAFEARAKQWDKTPSLSKYVDLYLSVSHRDNPGRGCPIASLAAHISGQSPSIRKQFSAGVFAFTERIAKALPFEGSTNIKRRHAAAILSVMVGSLVLARATKGDRQLSNRILAEARASISLNYGL